MNTVLSTSVVLQADLGSGYITVGCAESCSFQYTNELIFKTDVNAGLMRKRRARIGDSTMQVQGLTTLVTDDALSAFEFIQEAVRRSEIPLRILFTDTGAIQKQIQGVYIVESIDIGSGKEPGQSDYDITFKGSGTISLADPDDEGTIIPGDLQWDWWEATPGENTITGAGNYGRSFAGEEVILVDREGVQYDEVVGTPSGREYSKTSTVITFDATIPFSEAGERVYVVWKNV